MASMAPRVEIGFDHDSGVARSSRAGTKRSVKAGRSFYAYIPFTQVHIPVLPNRDFAGKTGFGDFPDALTLVGMAVIGGSGLLLTWHERRRALMAPAEPTAID